MSRRNCANDYSSFETSHLFYLKAYSDKQILYKLLHNIEEKQHSKIIPLHMENTFWLGAYSNSSQHSVRTWHWLDGTQVSNFHFKGSPSSCTSLKSSSVFNCSQEESSINLLDDWINVDILSLPNNNSDDPNSLKCLSLVFGRIQDGVSLHVEDCDKKLPYICTKRTFHHVHKYTYQNYCFIH